MDMLGTIDHTELFSDSSVGSNFVVRSIPSRISEFQLFIDPTPRTETKTLVAALRSEPAGTKFFYYTGLYNRFDSPEEASSTNSYKPLCMNLLQDIIPINYELTHYLTRLVSRALHHIESYYWLPLPDKTLEIESSASTLNHPCGYRWDLSPDSTAKVSDYLDRLLGLIVTGIPEWIVESRIKLIYQIVEPAAVAEFLRDNAFLNDLLVEARSKIVEFFGNETKVQLELIDDPDFLGNPKLYAVILTPLTAMEAMPIQERLDNEWWLGNLERAQGKFNIVLEYV